MSDTLDKGLFSVNERPREYEVRFSVRGEIHATVTADSIEDARRKAEAMTEDDDFGLDLDKAEEVSVGHIWKSKPMYRVMRDGRPMQTSHLEPGDLPREPDERGF